MATPPKNNTAPKVTPTPEVAPKAEFTVRNTRENRLRIGLLVIEGKGVCTLTDEHLADEKLMAKVFHGIKIKVLEQV